MNPDEPQTIQIQSDSQEQTMRLAASIARRLKPGDLVALEGPLGSGKTCFVRGLAAGLGIDPDQVSSPTFVICQEYTPPPESPESQEPPVPPEPTKAQTAFDGPVLTHIDAYRLAGPDDLASIGWDELIESAESIIALEWPSKVAGALPSKRIEIAFAHVDLTTRDLTINAPADLADRIRHLADPYPRRCKTCNKPIDSNDEYFPFCTNRCRLADLNQWFKGSYSVSRPIEEDDLYQE